MKKLALLLAILLPLLAPSALGQSVGASQIRKKTNAGLVADSANALALGIYRGTSAPASPVTGQAWLDTTTTPATLKTYSGSAWEITPSSAAITQADLTSFPSTPSDGQIVWLRNQKRAIVYDATAAAWYYLDTQRAVAGADYALETAGYSTAFLSSPGATTGTTASGGSMTSGTHVCAATFYNATGGETTPGASTAALDTTTNKTAQLTFSAGGAGVAGKRLWCSKANTTTPLFLVASIDDASTTTYNVTVADASFGVVTAPDVDFSAPLPTGWLTYRASYLYGGCGSTGASLLCAAYKIDTGGSTGTASIGVRLYYPVPSPSSNWRAALRIVRMASGFPGYSAGWGSPKPIISVTRAYDVGSAVSRSGLIQIASNADPLPINTSTTPVFGMGYRAEGAYTVGATTYVRPWPPVTGFPIYVELAMKRDGANHVYRGQASGNGTDWSSFGTTTGEVYNQTISNSSEFGNLGAVALNYVGIDLQSFTGAGYGFVYEFDSFTIAAE